MVDDVVVPDDARDHDDPDDDVVEDHLRLILRMTSLMNHVGVMMRMTAMMMQMICTVPMLVAPVGELELVAEADVADAQDPMFLHQKPKLILSQLLLRCFLLQKLHASLVADDDPPEQFLEHDVAPFAVVAALDAAADAAAHWHDACPPPARRAGKPHAKTRLAGRPQGRPAARRAALARYLPGSSRAAPASHATTGPPLA